MQQAWSCTLSPTSGAPGTTVTLTGNNFGQSASLEVRWGTATGTLLTTGATDGQGRVVGPVTFTVPAVAPGTYLVTARDGVAGYPVNVTFVVQ
jgi:hypothetical protein